MKSRISKVMAVMFALALGLAVSCGGSDSGGSGGAAGYTPDNAPTDIGNTNLTTSEQAQVETYVTSYVVGLAGAWSGTTSKSAEKYSQCFNEPVGECSSAQYCVEASGSQSSGHVKVWMDEAMDCNGVNIYFWEYDVDYSYLDISLTQPNTLYSMSRCEGLSPNIRGDGLSIFNGRCMSSVFNKSSGKVCESPEASKTQHIG